MSRVINRRSVSWFLKWHIAEFIFLSFHFSTVKKGISNSSNTASADTFKVVDAVIDALTSQRPQTRYAVGLDAKVSIFLSFLPTFIPDYLFGRKKG